MSKGVETGVFRCENDQQRLYGWHTGRTGGTPYGGSPTHPPLSPTNIPKNKRGDSKGDYIMKRLKVQRLLMLKLLGVKVYHIVCGLYIAPVSVVHDGKRFKGVRYRLQRLI